MAGRPITVLACESEPVVVEGLRKTLESFPDFSLAGAVCSPAEALEAIAALDPDVVLVDHESGAHAADLLLEGIRTAGARARVVVWVHGRGDAERARLAQLGARGLAPKSCPIEALLECLRAVAAGGLWLDGAAPEAEDNGLPRRRTPPRLTRREREVLGLLATGMKNTEIARALAIAPGTVKVHLTHIFEKTGTSDRFDLAIRSRKLLGGDERA